MSGTFEALPGGRAAVALDEVEISILRSLTVQLLELIGPGDEPAPAEGGDPLDAMFQGLTEGPSEPPSDPALARLFPDAYRDPDAKLGADEEEEARRASAEFRRYTENDLRSRKREDALTVVRTLDALGLTRPGGARGAERPGGTGAAERGRAGGRHTPDGLAVLELRPEESTRWLGTLNDLRLTIGTRLEVTDEDDGGELLRLPDDDPRKPMVMAYFWLGGLQETLVEALMS